MGNLSSSCEAKIEFLYISMSNLLDEKEGSLIQIVLNSNVTVLIFSCDSYLHKNCIKVLYCLYHITQFSFCMF